MPNRVFGWDLPPGVRVSDIPGNRPEDEKWDQIYSHFFDKKRLLDKNRAGTPLTNDDYNLMDKLYKSTKLSDAIDKYITQAIEFGIDLGHKETENNQQQNRFYETRFIVEALEKAKVSQEVIDKVSKILHGDYETP